MVFHVPMDGGQTLMRHDLAADATSIASARSYVGTVLSELGQPQRSVRRGQLLASELVTNAIQHASPPIEIALSQVGDGFRIEVSDCSSARPFVRDGDPHGPRGRGLQIVETLATRWGAAARGDGKVVWCVLGDRVPPTTPGDQV